MKTGTQDCGRGREAIRAWVGEGVASEQAAQIQSHLATCGDCRHYAEELRAAAAGLRWVAARQVEPSPGFRARWTRAVEDAARPSSFGEAAGALVAWWRGLLLRNLRPALGIASLWILALLFRLSAPEVSPAAHTTAARSPIEIFRALKAPEQLLAGELGQPIAAPVAPQKPHSARPRSEGFPTEPTVRQDRELDRGAALAGLLPHLTDVSVQVSASFPLTPALSSGEREQTPTVCEHAVGHHA